MTPAASLLGFVIPPWVRWAAYLTLAFATYGVGRVHQARDDQAAEDARNVARMTATTDRLVRRAIVAQSIAAAHEIDQARIETVYRTITREVAHVVDRPIYRDCRLDPDGVRLINAALGGSAPADPASIPADPVR